MCKVSVLVSAYYAEDYLEGRIVNLLEQSGVAFEILVACQKDSVEHEIMKGFDLDQIRVYPTEDIPGLYATWNELISVAQGEYLTNANSDDRLFPGALQRLAETLDAHPEVGVAYGYDDVVYEVDGLPRNRHQWPDGGFRELIEGCFIGPMPMWRASLHENYGLFDTTFKSAGDYEMWLRLAKHDVKFQVVPVVIGEYVKRADSLQYRQSLLSVWETARAKGKHVNWKTLFDQEEVL